MEFRRTAEQDASALTDMRIEFLSENGGSPEKAEALRAQISGYLERHLGEDLLAYIAEENGEAVSSAFLLICERPANLSFPSGRVGTVLNVYTKPACRRRGAAKQLMKMALADARARGLSYIELKATDEGRPLYESLGYASDTFGDVPMKYDLRGFRIEPVAQCRKRYIDLLLMADEQENMIERYLDRGDMYALVDEGEARCVCVVTDEGEGVLELKNIATAPGFRGIRTSYDRVFVRALPRQFLHYARGDGRQPGFGAFLREMRL